MITFRRCFMAPEGEGGSGAAAGNGGDTGNAGGSGSSGGQPSSGGAGSGQGGAAGNGGDGEPGPIPYVRFKEVNDELARRRAADEKRERDELTAKGEHEKVATQEREKREAAEARAVTIARRAAFMGKAAGKVADPEAAVKLAQADGLLGFDVDDDGAPKDAKAVDAAVDEITKRYPFLKAQGAATRDFGNGHGATGGAPAVDIEKLSPVQKMELGISQGAGRPTR
jgi:hypothetical protein